MILPCKIQAILSSSSTSSLVFCWMEHSVPSAECSPDTLRMSWISLSIEMWRLSCNNNISSICRLLVLCNLWNWSKLGSLREHEQETEACTECQLAGLPTRNGTKTTWHWWQWGHDDTSSFTSTDRIFLLINMNHCELPLLLFILLTTIDYRKTCVVTY